MAGERYQQHHNLAQIGVAGQARLSASQVLIIGAGGLGVPAAIYLNAAGVGSLTISDFDHIEVSNLQRQVLYTEADVGALKAATAVAALARQNSQTRLRAIDHALQDEALDEAVQAADVVLDCCDNFETRFAINEACVRAARPWVSGAALGMVGQVISFDVREPTSPCYRCLYSDALATDETCAVAGVLGPLVGVIGTLQAVAAVHLLLGTHPGLGRLQLFDVAPMQWRQVNVPKDPSCPVCSQRKP